MNWNVEFDAGTEVLGLLCATFIRFTEQGMIAVEFCTMLSGLGLSLEPHHWCSVSPKAQSPPSSSPHTPKRDKDP